MIKCKCGKPCYHGRCKSCANKDRKGKYHHNSINMIGNKNHEWKGDKVGYHALHEWVRHHKPKSMFCEKCGKITSSLDCANISGEYKRDISDFRWLCRSCHKKEHFKFKGGKND